MREWPVREESSISRKGTLEDRARSIFAELYCKLAITYEFQGRVDDAAAERTTTAQLAPAKQERAPAASPRSGRIFPRNAIQPSSVNRL